MSEQTDDLSDGVVALTLSLIIGWFAWAAMFLLMYMLTRNTVVASLVALAVGIYVGERSHHYIKIQSEKDTK